MAFSYIILSFSVQVIKFFLNCALIKVTIYPSRIKDEYITGDLSVTVPAIASFIIVADDDGKQ
jgi:hypothetical protein